jgi:hypothetical protein
MNTDMKPNITITVQGQCSERKYELAKDIAQFLKTRGYGKVTLSGIDDGNHIKGVIRTEKVNIEVIPFPRRPHPEPIIEELNKKFDKKREIHIQEEIP